MLATGVLVWLLILVGLVVVWVRPRASSRQQCPSCNVPLIPMEPGEHDEPRDYDVLLCKACSNTVTRARGEAETLARCPQCSLHALETPCMRLPDVDGKPQVEVHEQCGHCRYETVRVLPEPEANGKPRGIVIPFPTASEHRSSG